MRGAAQERGNDVVADFFEYVAFNLSLAFLSSFSLWAISPAASGSGIPDVKAFLNGVDSPIFAQFFRIRTFVAKVLTAQLLRGPGTLQRAPPATPSACSGGSMHHEGGGMCAGGRPRGACGASGALQG